MSGTSYGACVLHVAPEAAVGGPLAAVRNGDLIRIDVERRTIDLLVDEAEIAARLAAVKRGMAGPGRGFVGLFRQHVRQANLGCDFDFLEGVEDMPEPEIH